MDELDKTDIGILQLLEQDGRLNHKQIAHQLHKTVNPIHLRIRKLLQKGFIKRFTIIVDHKKVGRGLIAYTQVLLKQHSRETLANFKQEVVQLPEVMECYHMTGGFDFLLRIAIRDMDEYNALLTNKLSGLPDVGKLESFFVMSVNKHETSLVFGRT